MIDRLTTNLWIISCEAKSNPMRRYIAKPFGGNGYGVAGWRVFDQKQGRFLKNRETEALSEREVREGI